MVSDIDDEGLFGRVADGTQTQITSLHGVSMLDAAQNSLEANVNLALLYIAGGENDRKLINARHRRWNSILHGTPALAAAQAAREAGNAPNSVLAAAASIVGPRRRARALGDASTALIDMLTSGPRGTLSTFHSLRRERGSPRTPPHELLSVQHARRRRRCDARGLKARGAHSVFVRYLESLDGHPSADAVLAAITTTLAWGPLMRKRVSRLTAENLPWWMRLFGTLIGASVSAERHQADRFCGMAIADILGKRSLTDVAYVALFELAPEAAQLFAFQTTWPGLHLYQPAA